MYIFLSLPEGAVSPPAPSISRNSTTSNGRISVSSLLNNTDEPTRATMPVAFSSRENSLTPFTNDGSPSPTMSSVSWSSNGTSRRSTPPPRFRGSSQDLVRMPASPPRHTYSPYSTSRRNRAGTTTRQSRPSYEIEEAYFIWFLKVDLNLDWEEARARFNKQFVRQRIGIQGLQCKFYRFLTDNGLPPVRERKRNPDAQKVYSLKTCKPDVWYDWMRPGATENL